MHARYLRDSRAFIHLCVSNAAEFREEGVYDPGIVVLDRAGRKEVEGEGGEEVERGLDVRLEFEGEGAGYGFVEGGEVTPEVFGLREGEGVEGLGFGEGDCAGEEEGVERGGGAGGVRVVEGDGVVLDAADGRVVEG